MKTDINCTDKERWTPLLCAVGTDNLELVEYLYAQGADLNCTVNGVSPLGRAIRFGSYDIIKFLIDKGVVVQTYYDSYTPLFNAAGLGRYKTCKLLLENGAKKDINKTDKYETTPLIEAAKNGHAEVVELLIENRAKINAHWETGSTALHEAVENNHTDVAKILLFHGADKAFKAGHLYKSPVEMAVEIGNEEMIRILSNDESAFEELHFKDLTKRLSAIDLTDKENATSQIIALLKEDKELTGWVVKEYSDEKDSIITKGIELLTELQTQQSNTYLEKIAQDFENKAKYYTQKSEETPGESNREQELFYRSQKLKETYASEASRIRELQTQRINDQLNTI